MVLTRELAILRSECFDVSKYIQYHVFMELLRGKSYKASVIIEFNLKHLNGSIKLDWQHNNIDKLIINQQAQQYLCDENQITFDNSCLKLGQNVIQIQFEAQYQTSGHGLHSFIDADNAQYVYSQLEPHHASEMMPCFDQPDLKAHFKLSVQLPKEWIAISNQQYSEPQNTFFIEKEDYYIQEFMNTLPLSTYLFAILAGPFQQIKCQNLYNNIPMSLFCRTSMLQHLQNDAEELFEMTKKGMQYYEKLFQTPYPFSKYDQIFCPEFSSGAMENAGAVTINDCYIFKEEVPISERAERGNTLLHELSHMWFGDLVTMQWWDDLWLNESFAEFISHLCQWKIDTTVDHWVQFLQRKIWGYNEDQMQTTHPIYCEILNTDQAENIFDGITYSKGAALLKQLFFIMGENNFSNAMGQYFKLYAFKNTTLKDFFNVMQAQFPGDFLNQWQQDWIMKAGLNTVQAEVQDNGFVQFTQEATLQEHPTLRTQIFQVAIIDSNGKQLRTQQVHLLPQEHTNLDLQVSKGDLVLLNYNDESFVKTLYTQEQVKFILKHLSLIEPSLSRIQYQDRYGIRSGMAKLAFQRLQMEVYQIIYQQKVMIQLTKWYYLGVLEGFPFTHQENIVQNQK